MTVNIPNNGKWIQQFPEEVQTLLAEKLEYGNRLTDVLENIKIAALGIDPQSKMQLRLLEQDVIKVLRKTHNEIKDLVQTHISESEMKKYQGKLFDV